MCKAVQIHILVIFLIIGIQGSVFALTGTELFLGTKFYTGEIKHVAVVKSVNDDGTLQIVHSGSLGKDKEGVGEVTRSTGNYYRFLRGEGIKYQLHKVTEKIKSATDSVVQRAGSSKDTK